MADEGLRVLAVARRRWTELPESRTPDEIERDLTLIGLVGLLDPPRPEAKAAVALCKTAGITPIMITGDHPATARSIAGELGISRPGDRIITGRELHGLSDAALAERIEGTPVFARVDPAQKIRIVSALQARGQFVAMTGDGVNDAPALAQADIGVAMGKAAPTWPAKRQAWSSSTTTLPPSSRPSPKDGASSRTSANSSAMSSPATPPRS